MTYQALTFEGNISIRHRIGRPEPGQAIDQ